MSLNCSTLSILRRMGTFVAWRCSEDSMNCFPSPLTVQSRRGSLGPFLVDVEYACGCESRFSTRMALRLGSRIVFGELVSLCVSWERSEDALLSRA